MKLVLRRFVVAVLLGAALVQSTAAVARERFPGKEWKYARSPESAGWSSEQLDAAKKFADSRDTEAVMIVHDGEVVHHWGPIDGVFMCHSMRKSILSALYGIYVDEGLIDLDDTLGDLGIDDNEPSLTEAEKSATVGDLLKARSGVYHAALYETASMTASKPKRGSHAPGTFWHYNNWDFNTLGAIFNHSVGSSLFVEFERLLAEPLGMQDFDRVKHTRYFTGPLSVYPAYPFQLSARDLARFGLLFARDGVWKGERILPEGWVAESTASYSDAGDSGGYGYMWWVAVDGMHLPNVTIPDGSYTARGAGGHYVLVIPDWDLVIVHRVNTYQDRSVTSGTFGRLLRLILEARPEDLAPDFDVAPAD